jgi:hypothetical protein
MGTARRLSIVVAVGAASVFAACGGGGGSKSTSAGGTASTSPAASTATTVVASTAAGATAGPIPVVAPNGFERVERLCYSVLLPKGNDANSGENSCVMRSHWDPVGGVYFQPDPYAKSLSEMVSRFKSDKNLHPLIVDRDMTVGGIPGHMFVEDTHTVTGPAQQATVVVYLPSKSYQVQGVPVSAFTISGNYSTAAQYPQYGANDKAFDNVVASVQWK